MAAWEFPGALIEVEFTPGVWTDLTPRLRPDLSTAFSFTRGRSSERERPEAGRATFVFDNLDRELEPKNPASSYWPEVRPLKRIRLFAIVSAVEIPLFSGFVTTWEIRWGENGFDATVTAEAVDAFGILALGSSSYYPAVVEEDRPVRYYKLGEAAGVAELQGTGGPAQIFGDLTFGHPGPLAGGSTAIRTGTFSPTPIVAAGVGTISNPTIEFWIQVDSYPGGTMELITSDNSGSSAYGPFSLFYSNGGAITFNYVVNGFAFGMPSDLGLLDLGTWVHVAIVKGNDAVRYYKNGVLFTVSSVLFQPGASDPSNDQLVIGGSPHGTSIGDQKLAHVAIYDYALSAARIAIHHSMTSGDIGPMASDEQIETLLDIFGWPAGERAITPGQYAMAGFTPSNPVLEDCLKIASSEGGLFVANALGELAFYPNDYSNLTGLVFGTDSGELLFEDMTLDYDEVQLWNDVTVKAPPLVQSIDDSRSVDRYFRRSLAVDTLLSNLTDVGKRARELLVNYREPRQRVVAIEHTKAQEDNWSDLLSADLLDEVTMRITPPGGGDPIIQASRIERITLSSSVAHDWQLRWDLSPIPRRNLLTHEQASPDTAGSDATVVARWSVQTNQPSALYDSSSPILPIAGATYIVAVHTSRSTAPAAIASFTGTGGFAVNPWTPLATFVDTTNTRRLSLFGGVAVSGQSGIINFNFVGGQSQTGMQLQILEIQGLFDDTPVQIVTASGATGNAAVTLAAFAHPNNPTIGIMTDQTITQNVAAGAGFLELSEQNIASQPGSMQSEWRDDSDTTVTWTNTSGPWIAMGLELSSGHLDPEWLWDGITNCEVKRTSFPVLDGAGALMMMSLASGDMAIGTSPPDPLPSVVTGTPYIASAFFLSPDVSRSAHVEVRWRTAGGTLVATDTGADITTDTIGWLGAWCEATVPATATQAQVVLVVEGTGAADETHYADEVLFTLDD